MNYEILEYTPLTKAEFLTPAAAFCVGWFCVWFILRFFGETPKKRLIGHAIFIPVILVYCIHLHFKVLERPVLYELKVRTPEGIVNYVPSQKK